MIPRTLPGLVKTAVLNGWDVQVTHHPDLYAVVTATLTLCGTEIEMVWSSGHLDHAAINGTPTPYQQCVRLIRSTEEN